MRWVGHIACTGVEGNAYRFVTGQLESKSAWKMWE